MDVPVLTDKYRGDLDRPIMAEETLKALKSMQSGKTPGPDGIPIEFYKQYPDLLTTRLHMMMTMATEQKSLPQSMGEAVIVVIPKPGKDPSVSIIPAYLPHKCRRKDFSQNSRQQA